MSDEESTADLTAERHPSIGAGWRPAPDAAKEIRDTVLRHVEAQRASLEQLRRQIQKSQMDQEGGDALDWIEQRLTFLDGIEATANSAPLPALLSLSFAMPAIATATATVLSAAKAEAAMQIGTAMGEMSTEAYHHYSHALEARVRTTDAINGRHFQSAMGTLDRHGLGGHFRHVQSSLEAEREEAEKRGEHGKARVADSLIAHNTLNALDKALDVEDDPKKREQLESERKRQLDVIAEREAAMRKQFELDGRRAAQQRGLTGKEADEFVRGHIAQEQQSYEQRRDKQREEAGINDRSRYPEALQTIGGQAAEMEQKIEIDLLASKRHMKAEASKTATDHQPARGSLSVAQAITDVQQASAGLSNRKTAASGTLEAVEFGDDTPTQAATPTKLAEAKAQADAQQLSKAKIMPDETQDKRTDPSPPERTPAAAKTSVGRSPA